MQVTGYKIQHTLREKAQLRDVMCAQYSDSLMAFEGDERKDPKALIASIVLTEDQIARLQVAQTIYNLAVRVNVQGEEMALSQAVKLVGSAGRVEKMWRQAANPKASERYYRQDTRDASALVAKPVVKPEEALTYATRASRRASALREAIQVGNGQAIEIEIDPSLFE